MHQRPLGLVAMAQVADVANSIAFYEMLGLQVDHTHVPPAAAAPVWAHMQSGNAHLMLAKATAPVIPEQQAVLFYLYFSDVAAKHQELLEGGVNVGELCFPFYCPKGEFRVTDPDGYTVMCTHT